MNTLKRALCLVLVLALALCMFTACKKADEDEPEQEKNYASSGGSINWPEGMDTTTRFASQKEGDVLYISYNGIQNRTSGYFEPAGSSVNITTTGVTESANRKEYRLTLWLETGTGREYVTDSTVYVTADNTHYTASFDGLTPGARYKIGIAYDGGSNYMSGGISISGLQGAEDVDTSDSAAA